MDQRAEAEQDAAAGRRKYCPQKALEHGRR